MKPFLEHFIVVGIAVFFIYFFTSKYSVRLTNESPMMSPSPFLEHLTFGYADVLADSLWIRLIQDFDYCGREHSPSFITHNQDSPFKKKEEMVTPLLASHETTHLPRCQKGWSFQMLDKITDLTPRFEMAYTLGAPGLSIMVDDREGAELLFEKGVNALPKNWQIPYMAAYHALFETKKYEKAARFLEQAGHRGGPDWVYLLATKIYSQMGRAELGKTVISQYISQFPPDKVPKRAQERLAEVEKILAQKDNKDYREEKSERKPTSNTSTSF